MLSRFIKRGATGVVSLCLRMLFEPVPCFSLFARLVESNSPTGAGVGRPARFTRSSVVWHLADANGLFAALSPPALVWRLLDSTIPFFMGRSSR